ncbi:MAG: 7-carboxy-7-deazaguanine synthase [Rhodobacteraceae bacterium]|nr:7-carboxy-7-deazaguanine synthase [Paracoccaceae bacterium]
MVYAVKELFHTLQGEGANAGRPAVFCRFAGCNLWSGVESDRDSSVCQFCDTDFVGTDGIGGGKFTTAAVLADAIAETWKGGEAKRFVVFTGGEPLLQLDDALVDAVHERGFTIAVETNGTLPVPGGVDWVCVSPKAQTEIKIAAGDELKLIYPQAGAAPERYDGLSFAHRFLQPMDGPDRAANTAKAVAFCLTHPRWRLSAQTHKYLGIR